MSVYFLYCLLPIETETVLAAALSWHTPLFSSSISLHLHSTRTKDSGMQRQRLRLIGCIRWAPLEAGGGGVQRVSDSIKTFEKVQRGPIPALWLLRPTVASLLSSTSPTRLPLSPICLTLGTDPECCDGRLGLLSPICWGWGFLICFKKGVCDFGEREGEGKAEGWRGERGASEQGNKVIGKRGEREREGGRHRERERERGTETENNNNPMQTFV